MNKKKLQKNWFKSAFLFAATILCVNNIAAQVITQTLSYTGGTQTLNIPGCAQVTVTCYGANGANGSIGSPAASIGGTGGLGAITSGVYSSPASVLNVYVGGAGTGSVGGFNGGGNGGNTNAGGGGGGSDVRVGGTALANRIITAGGGGGGGTGGYYWGGSPTFMPGGNGGNSSNNGFNGTTSAAGGGGFGGTVSSAGAPGIGCNFATAIGTVGISGTSGIGGAGGDGASCCGAINPGGGGGGGGFVGGGGGGGGSAGTTSCSLNDKGAGGGGAGGTNFFSAAFTSSALTNGTNSGNGYVVISYSLLPIPTIIVNSGAICAGNSFTILPSGANTYTISGGSSVVTPTSNASYNVTGTSAAGCVSSNTAVSSVTVNPLPVIVAASSTSVLCIGQTATLNANGANTYTWSTGSNSTSIVITPTANVTYTVIGTSTAGCVSPSAAVNNVTLNALPTLSVVTNNSIICTGNSATLTVSGANTYTWSTSSNSANIAVTPTANTSYTVNGTAANGCSNVTTITQSVSLCTEIASNVGNGSFGVNIFPNPSNGVITLNFASLSENVNIELYNCIGQLIVSEKATNLNFNLNFENAENGIYILRITENGNNVFNSKVVKN